MYEKNYENLFKHLVKEGGVSLTDYNFDVIQFIKDKISELDIEYRLPLQERYGLNDGKPKCEEEIEEFLKASEHKEIFKDYDANRIARRIHGAFNVLEELPELSQYQPRDLRLRTYFKNDVRADDVVAALHSIGIKNMNDFKDAAKTSSIISKLRKAKVEKSLITKIVECMYKNDMTPKGFLDVNVLGSGNIYYLNYNGIFKEKDLVKTYQNKPEILSEIFNSDGLKDIEAYVEAIQQKKTPLTTLKLGDITEFHLYKAGIKSVEALKDAYAKDNSNKYWISPKKLEEIKPILESKKRVTRKSVAAVLEKAREDKPNNKPEVKIAPEIVAAIENTNNPEVLEHIMRLATAKMLYMVAPR
ncbi:MAG: hypothetical protein LBM38_00460 [Clostridiales bacterium]|jgi:hypothetical protein|nr:hypothetical protein [Clostridiales bacterium]